MIKSIQWTLSIDIPGVVTHEIKMWTVFIKANRCTEGPGHLTCILRGHIIVNSRDLPEDVEIKVTCRWTLAS